MYSLEFEFSIVEQEKKRKSTPQKHAVAYETFLTLVSDHLLMAYVPVSSFIFLPSLLLILCNKPPYLTTP